MNTRDTQIIIEPNHLIHNYKTYQQKSSLEVFAVVKANAYGHGDIIVSKTLEPYVKVFCVSSLDEAIHLYHAGIRKDILIFSYVDIKMIEKYHQDNFIYTALSLDWVKSLLTLNKKIRVHIKVDTGMNRVGIKDIEEIKEILTLINVEGIYTHFSSSDDNKEVTLHQLSQFETILKDLNVSFKWVHTSNTHASSYVTSKHINAMRLGIGLYGYEKDTSDLKQVMHLMTKVIHLFEVDENETIGYNQTYKVDKKSKIATLPIGYADGIDMRFKYV
ncbi:MAG TPA: alanine racemase, partial [Erysipelothrix sp.]|nr:alanine racemase [Erysipelothrix sp.]